MEIEVAPVDLSPFFKNHPTLETERLILRKIRVEDAEDIFEYEGDPECTQYVWFNTSTDVEQTRRTIAGIIKSLDEGNGFYFAVALKGTGKVIGTADLFRVDTVNRKLIAGWMMTKEFWGNGYMSEAMREVIRFTFQELGLHRIEAEIETENIQSQKLAERIGMMREATLIENENSKGRFVSNHLYAIINHE